MKKKPTNRTAKKATPKKNNPNNSKGKRTQKTEKNNGGGNKRPPTDNKKNADGNDGGGTPIGRTLKTKDKHLPYDPKKVVELKEKRWVAVIDKNTHEELAVVRLTDENQPNTTKLLRYLTGNNKDTYFKHFVEITDNNGKPITIDNNRFFENSKKYDLPEESIQQILSTVLEHCKQIQANRKKIKDLKDRDDD